MSSMKRPPCTQLLTTKKSHILKQKLPMKSQYMLHFNHLLNLLLTKTIKAKPKRASS